MRDIPWRVAKDLTGRDLSTLTIGSFRSAWIARAASRTAAPVRDFVVGDDADLDPEEFLRNAASGVPIRIDRQQHCVRLSTSIVGMPPIYLYRDARIVALTSDVHLLRTIPGLQLELDTTGVIELGHVGHPTEQRTLFRNVSLVESGVHLTLTADGRVSIEHAWCFPKLPPFNWTEFLETQIVQFTTAMQRTRVEDSFLSLTAGLDTRTILSSLAAQKRLVPAATMTGVPLSLDARIARRLCSAYDLEHILVTFDHTFSRELPSLLESASLLSGGLATLDQAPEVYFYNQLNGRFRARLSGNLGNQVGRGGTEGVSTRGAQLGILSDRFEAAASEVATKRDHWLLSHLNDTQHARLDFILRKETVFSSVGNYSIGNHFAIQQSPYCTRGLIETLAHRPAHEVGAPSSSKLHMYLRDLRHRFLGEPEQRSFQRKLVSHTKGFAAECAINWGWKPKGGVSPMGSLLGAATLLGMLAHTRGFDARLLRAPVRATGLPSLYDFRDSRRWLLDLRDFTYDTLQARSVRDADLFDTKQLGTVLDEHFAGRKDAYHTLSFALDVALAHRSFCQTR